MKTEQKNENVIEKVEPTIVKKIDVKPIDDLNLNLNLNNPKFKDTTHLQENILYITNEIIQGSHLTTVGYDVKFEYSSEKRFRKRLLEIKRITSSSC